MQRRWQLALFIPIALFAIATAQDSGSQRFRAPLLERPGDAYMPPPPPSFNFFASGGSGSWFGTYHSMQVNVDSNGQNIMGDAANEPSIVVDPLDRNKVAIAWRQFDNVNSNFRQAGNGYSNNNGFSWTFPGVLDPGIFRSDPVLSTTAAGKFYYLSLQESFYDDEFDSNNQGAVWNYLAPAEGGDKEWMTIDSTNSAGKGNIYQAWSTAGNNWNGRQFTRSVDGGQTWMSPINLPNQPIWGVLDVDSSGTLYISGWDGNLFHVIRSQNAKYSNQTPTFDMDTEVSLGGSLSYGDIVNPDGLLGQAWMAVDRSGTSTDGNIYLLCSVYRNSSNPCDVMFSRSTDHGAHWSTPVRINDDALNQDRYHWFGALSVAPNGRIDVVWYDTRGDSTNDNSALFISHSDDGGLTWAKNVQLSQYFNEHVGYPDQDKIGDYICVVSDATGADIAYSATFNNEEDVYYLRVPEVSGATAVSPDSITMSFGTSAKGTVDDVKFVDVNRYDVISGLAGSYTQQSTTDHGFTLPFAPNSASVQFRVVVPEPCVATVYLWNYSTSQYDLVGGTSIPPGEGGTDTIPVTMPLTPYVDGSLHMKARLRVVGKQPVGSFAFNMQEDLMQLAIK